MKISIPLLFLLLSLSLNGQFSVTQGSLPSTQRNLSQAGIDTILPDLASDSCISASTYFLLNNRIVSGAAVLNSGSVISRVGQAFDSGGDSIGIGSIFAELVYTRNDSGNGQFVAQIYSEQDLQTPLGQSLPVSGNLLTDTSGPSIYNDFFFSNPVYLQGKFWVVINVMDGGDSIYLASTGDDCGMGSAIFYDGQDWRLYKDQFTTGASDPLDIALKIGVVAEPVVNLSEPHLQESILLYPNPVSAGVQLVLPLSNETAEVEVFSSKGELKQSIGDFTSGEVLDMNALKPGIYILRIRQGEYVFTSKVVVSR